MIWVGVFASVVWLAELLGLTAMIIGAGWVITGRYFGAIIDSRNRASLSRLQAALWTLLVLSALLAATMVNLHAIATTPDSHALTSLVTTARTAAGSTDKGPFDAFDFAIPNELLAAIGIAGFSLVATPMAQSTKTQTAADPAALAAVMAIDKDPSGVLPDGNIFGRMSKAGAVWADIFRGDDVDSASTVDLSKVQQFVVTVVLIGVYGGAVWLLLSGSTPFVVASLPPLSEKFIWLLGISHAGYLANKLAPH